MKWYFRRGWEAAQMQANFPQHLEHLFLARRLWDHIRRNKWEAIAA